METVGAHEQHEEMLQSNLLEAYAEQEVTLFGVTATLADLKGLCPVKDNDPRMTLEAQNEFVVKAINIAGADIKPEHETAFNGIIEKLGLERNFVVTEPKPTLAPESPIRNAVEAPHVLVRQTADVVQKTPVLHEALEHAEFTRTDLDLQQVLLVAEQTEVAKVVQEDIVVLPEQTGETNNSQTVLAELPTQQATVIQEAPLKVVTEAVVAPARPPSPFVALPAVESVSEAVSLPGEVAPVITTQKTDEIATFARTRHEPPSRTEQVEADEQPTEFYLPSEETVAHIEQFIATLQSLEVSTVSVENNDETVAATSELVVAQPVIQLVQERLSESSAELLEELAPVMHEISAITEALVDMDPALREAVESRLIELCQELLAKLDIPADEQSVRFFVSALMKQALIENQQPERLTDLGTHEMKHFAQAIVNFINDEVPLHAALGMVAILRSAYRTQRSAVAA